MDFSLILFVGSVVTGLIWLFDHYVLAPRRHGSGAAGVAAVGQPLPAPKDPVIVEWAKSFFPVLIIIFFLRSFLFEPFRIPSGSMKPTLVEGDFILVNKFSYGIRLPILNKKVVDTWQPQRGDVVVFRFPVNPTQDYIKRIVGLPGDRILYQDKQLLIKPYCAAVQTECPKAYQVERSLVAAGGFENHGLAADIWQEQLGAVSHQILIHPELGQAQPYFGGRNEWVVPEGHYFAMGDNRDQSADSRFWGFVPDDHLKGKAVAVWMHLDFEFENPLISWIPTGVSLSRIGGID